MCVQLNRLRHPLFPAAPLPEQEGEGGAGHRRWSARRGEGESWRERPLGRGGGEQREEIVRPVGRIRGKEDDDLWDPRVSVCGVGESKQLLGFAEW